MIDMAKETHSEKEKSEIIERFNKIEKHKFFEICNEHELDGVVGAFAKSIGIELPDFWEKEYVRQSEHLLFLKEKAVEICEIMKNNGIDMVVLKNGGIMVDMIDDAVKCPMEDIDSLVKKDDFFKAHKILVENGFNFKFRSEYEFEILDEAFRDGSTEYYIVTPGGEKMWFELAWRSVAGRWIRPDLEPDTNEFIDNSYCADGTSVHILSPEDNLLQVCIHTAKHSYVRAPGLRLHMDVDRIVTHKNIDWDKFLEKVKKAHVKTSTFISLYIPSVLFGTNIPQYVLDELCPKNAEKLLKALSDAKLLHPKKAKFSKIEFLKFQTGLYDNFGDILRVIYPSTAWITQRYNAKNVFDIIKCVIFRTLDLVGIRKKK